MSFPLPRRDSQLATRFFSFIRDVFSEWNYHKWTESCARETLFFLINYSRVQSKTTSLHHIWIDNTMVSAISLNLSDNFKIDTLCCHLHTLHNTAKQTLQSITRRKNSSLTLKGMTNVKPKHKVNWISIDFA